MNNKYQEALNNLSDYIDIKGDLKGEDNISHFNKLNVETLQELIDREFGDNLLIGSQCEILNLYILDKDNNYIHKIGTDNHDSLYFENNKIHYYNLQNSGGCTFGEESKDWYQFSCEKEWCKQRIMELILEEENEKTNAK